MGFFLSVKQINWPSTPWETPCVVIVRAVYRYGVESPFPAPLNPDVASDWLWPVECVWKWEVSLPVRGFQSYCGLMFTTLLPLCLLSLTLMMLEMVQPGSSQTGSWREERQVLQQTCNPVQFTCSVVSDSLQPHGLQPGVPTPRAHSNSCPWSQWCHPTFSSSVIPFSSCFPSFPAWGSFLRSQFFSSGIQSIRASASASVLPINVQYWFPLGLTGLISLQSKGLSSVFSSTTVQKHKFFSAQLSLWPKSHIHTWLLEKP